MKRLIYTFRYLTRNRGNNLIRILSMTLGLVVRRYSAVAGSFRHLFRPFFPDADRIYQARFVWVGENERRGRRGCSESLVRSARRAGERSQARCFPPTQFTSLFYYEDHPHVFQGLYHADSVFSIFSVKLTQGISSGFLSDRNIFLSGIVRNGCSAGEIRSGKSSFTTSPPLTPWRACSRIFRKTAH